jgi:hypothetical protein
MIQLALCITRANLLLNEGITMKILSTSLLAVILSLSLITLAVAVDAVDPLVGTWECTNNIFTYEVSFFDDGLLLQEEPTFSNVKSNRWLRLGEDKFIIKQQGATYNTYFRSNDELTVTNSNFPTTWECSRKQ